MTGAVNGDAEQARRFRELALPYLDDVFTYARYMMRDPADAEDAVQECYLRAFRHFGSYRGPSIKPWLLAILKNVCHAEFARRGRHGVPSDWSDQDSATEGVPMWQEPPDSPEAALVQAQDSEAIRRMVDALPPQFREIIVLREISELSYDEIARVTGAPVGTVMSRLARARFMLRAAWKGAEGAMP